MELHAPPSLRTGCSTNSRAAVVAAAICLACRATWAAATEEAAAGADTLDAVLVTASKRSENILDVPASLWVATRADLERALARDFDDLARLAPSLTITKTTQPANNSINIRGIGTYAFSIATRPSVSVVVDDVPQAFQAQAFSALADVERIEVLRGPQSTLFGTSATAGVINISTAAPTAAFSSAARVMATGDGEHRLSGHVSGPLAANIGARLHVGSVSYRGNLRNLHTGRWINGHDDLTAQAKLVWEPTPDWRIALASRWNDTQGTCCTSAMYGLSPGVTFGRFQGYVANQAQVLAGVLPGPHNRLLSADIDPRADATDLGGSLRIERGLGGRSLAWITGLNRYRLRDLQDTDGTAFNWGPGGAGIPGAVAGGSANGGSFRVDSLSSELRLTSPAEGRLRYMAALFFSGVESDRSFVRGSNTLTRFGSLATVPPTTSAYSTYEAEARSDSYALFGTASYDVTPQLGVVGGLRVNHERMGYSLTDRFNRVSFGEPHCSTATASGLPISTCDRFTSWTGKAGLTYRLASSLMIFGGYDRGYKGAAYDLTSTYTTRSPVTAPGATQGYPVGDAVASRQPIAPETVDSYQLGIKGSWHDRLNLSLALYDATFRNYQAQSRDELTRQNILNSVEKVRTRGVELELAASLPGSMQLKLAGAYNDAVATRFPGASCYASQTAALGCVGGTQDLSGEPMSNAPRWTMNVDLSGGIPFGPHQRLTLGAGFRWQSEVLYSLLRDPQSLQKAYGLLHVDAAMEVGRWKLRAFVVNALDRSYALSRSRDGNWNINPYGASAGPATDAVKWAPGRDSSRYVGLELSAQLSRLTAR